MDHHRRRPRPRSPGAPADRERPRLRARRLGPADRWARTDRRPPTLTDHIGRPGPHETAPGTRPDPALGFLLARVFNGEKSVRETLRLHSPASFTLWRFAATDIELGGIGLPARAPILIDIQGINTDPGRSIGPDLAFGAGPHYCTGAQLAQLELQAVVDVLNSDFPEARLAVPYTELRQTDLGGIQGSRLTALPVRLNP